MVSPYSKNMSTTSVQKGPCLMWASLVGTSPEAADAQKKGKLLERRYDLGKALRGENLLGKAECPFHC